VVSDKRRFRSHLRAKAAAVGSMYRPDTSKPWSKTTGGRPVTPAGPALTRACTVSRLPRSNRSGGSDRASLR